MKCANKTDVEGARPQGIWVRDDNHRGWQCTACGEYVVLNVIKNGKYCPNCGAQMSIDIKGIVDTYFPYRKLK